MMSRGRPHMFASRRHHRWHRKNTEYIARWHLTDWLLSDEYGHIVVLFVVGVGLILAGAGAWIGCGKSKTDEYNNSYRQALWLSWGLFIDSGTQTNLVAFDGPAHKVVAMAFSVLGLLFNLVMLGLVVDKVRLKMELWQRQHGKVVINDHILVLGWTDRTLFALSEIAAAAEAQGGAQYRTAILVLGDKDLPTMQAELRDAYPNWRKLHPRVSVQLRTGRPFEVQDLVKASAQAARTIILLGASRHARIADAQSISTVLALYSLPSSPKCLLIVELRQQQSVYVVRRLANKRRLVPFVAASIVDAVLVRSVLSSSVGEVFVDLLSFNGNYIDTVPCDKQSGLEGATFGEARRKFPKAVALGVLLRGETVELAPSDARRLLSTDAIVLVVRGQDGWRSSARRSLATDTAELAAPSKQADTRREGDDSDNSDDSDDGDDDCDSLPHGPGRRRAVVATTVSAAAEFFIRAADEQEEASATIISFAPVPVHVPVPVPVPEPPSELRSRVLAIVGWSPRFAELLREFDRALPFGSELHVLSRKSEDWRKADLEHSHLGLDGTSPDGKSLKNVTLFHHFGFATDSSKLRRLPLERLQSVVVMADVEADATSSKIADSEAFTSTVLLRKLHDRCVKKNPELQALHIVTLFVDVLTKRNFNINPKLLKRANDDDSDCDDDGDDHYVVVCDDDHDHDVALAASSARSRVQGTTIAFHRNFLETAALTSSVHGAVGLQSICGLLGMRSGTAPFRSGTQHSPPFRSVPLDTYVQQQGSGVDATRLSFWELANIVRKTSGGLLVGWHLINRKRQLGIDYLRRHPPEINPCDRDKRTPFTWHREDLLLVVTQPNMSS